VRIGWFTPLSPRSAIGEFSRHVTAALARHAEVELYTADRPPWQPTALPVHAFEGTDALAELASLDAVLYNVGNHAPFHRAIHEVSLRRPGVVIVHDRVLHHLFAELWRDADGALAPAYVTRMRAYHGEGAALLAREVRAGRAEPPWQRDGAVTRHPLERAALRGALGAVTHSVEHARQLRAGWLGPVAAIAQPTYAPDRAAARPPGAARADGRVQLTTIGHVIPNKHVERVVAALAADPELAAHSHYTVAGPLDAGAPHTLALEAAVRAAPHVSVELLGWCEDAEIERLLAATDLFVNLREPAMESGSASLARELASARPVLCFATGAFAELPADAVARVPAGDFAAMAGRLRELVLDRGERERIGRRAAALAAQRDEEHYARALMGFLEEVRAAAPALALLDRIAGELGAVEADPSLPVYDAIAEDLGRVLFG